MKIIIALLVILVLFLTPLGGAAVGVGIAALMVYVVVWWIKAAASVPSVLAELKSVGQEIGRSIRKHPVRWGAAGLLLVALASPFIVKSAKASDMKRQVQGTYTNRSSSSMTKYIIISGSTCTLNMTGHVVSPPFAEKRISDFDPDTGTITLKPSGTLRVKNLSSGDVTLVDVDAFLGEGSYDKYSSETDIRLIDDELDSDH